MPGKRAALNGTALDKRNDDACTRDKAFCQLAAPLSDCQANGEAEDVIVIISLLTTLTPCAYKMATAIFSSNIVIVSLFLHVH